MKIRYLDNFKGLPLLFGSLLLFTFSCQTSIDKEILDQTEESHVMFEEGLSEVLEIMNENPEVALAQCDEIAERAEKVSSLYFSGKAKWYKAYIYDEILQDVSNAYVSYNLALGDLSQTDSSQIKVNVLNNLGILYRFYGQYQAAIKNYESALSYEKDLNEEEASDLYYNYGVALKLSGIDGAFEKAEDSFTKSLELAKAVDYDQNIASVNNQIGLMYKAIGDFEMSRIAYRNTIRTYRDNPDMRKYIGIAFHGLGVTYMEQGLPNEAIPSFEKALLFKKESGSIFITKYDLGTVLLRAGHIDEAVRTWKDALNEKHDRNDIEQVKIYSDLTKVLQDGKQFQEALNYSNIYNSSIASILEDTEKYKAENQKVLFADIVKEYDEFQVQENYWAEHKWWIMGLIGSILLGLGGWAMTYARSTRKVSRVVTEIESQFQNIKID